MSFAFIRRLRRNPRWPARRRDPAHELGRRGERAAARFLRRTGHHVIARNYRNSAGEIDLICSSGEAIVFVEVKTRSSEDAEDSQQALHPNQWLRIENAARRFLMLGPARGRPFRFDLVTVVWPQRGVPVIEHFENAHQPRYA